MKTMKDTHSSSPRANAGERSAPARRPRMAGKSAAHRIPRAFRRLCLASLAACFLAASCCDDDDVIVVANQGVVVADFQSIADYLADPTVQLILTTMPRHPGSSPPNARGQYSASGEIIASSIPDYPVGSDSGDFFFCLGTPAGNSLNAEVLDPSIEDGGAASFIEGSGDNFTVYTAFRSVDLDAVGKSCEIHEVVVISGTRQDNGTLTNLFIGQGVVGLVGDCPGVFVDDLTVAETTGVRIGLGCDVPSVGAENLVELVVDNSLINDIMVFVDYEEPPGSGNFVLGRQPFVVLPLQLSEPQFVPQGFFLSFESLQPARFDELGSENLLGEIIVGFFDQDVTFPGEGVTYLMENQVGDDVFFAPTPVNRTSDRVFTIVNSGFDFGATPEPVGSGLGCRCAIEPAANPEPQNIGYYSYSIPGFILPTEANVRFFRINDDFELPGFTGDDFVLEPSTGVVVLDVVEPPPPMPGVN